MNINTNKQQCSVTTSEKVRVEVFYQLEQTEDGVSTVAYVHPTHQLYENDPDFIAIESPHLFTVHLFHIGTNNIEVGITFDEMNRYKHRTLKIITNEIVPSVVENINNEVLQCK